MRSEHLEFVERVNEKRFKDTMSRRRFMGGVVAAAAEPPASRRSARAA
ncbi:MAG: hypothetical protein ACREQM_19235 [Candidatus Dormibacteraceae bacterium]